MTATRTIPDSRAEWLALRKRDVTASDMAALFGAHPYRTALKLYAIKSGLLDDDEETPAMRRGKHMEVVAERILREEHPDWIVEANAAYWSDAAVRIGATPDFIVRRPDRSGFGVVQVKSVADMIWRKQWKQPDGTIDPPLYAVVQAHIEQRLTGASWAAVLPIVVSFGIEMPLIEFDIHEGIWDRAVDETAAFWRMVADRRPPPADYGRDADTIDDIWPPQPDAEPIDLTHDNMMHDAIAKSRYASDLRAAATKDYDYATTIIAEKMAGASKARVGDRIVTRKLTRRSAYTVKAGEYVRTTIKGE